VIALVATLAAAAADIPAKQVAAYAEEVRTSAGSVIAIVTADAADQRAAEILLGTTGGWVYMLAVTQAQAESALRRKGLRCGLRLARVDTELWSVQEVGACGRDVPAPPAPAPAVAPAAPVVAPAAPVVAPPAPAAPPPAVVRPPPTAAVSAEADPAAWRKTQTDLLRLERSVPDPATALLLSTFVGFGSGHRYAGDDEAADLHLGVQAAGLGLYAVASTIAAALATSDPDAAGGAVFVAGVGGGVFVIDRVVEAGFAPKKAHEGADRVLSSGKPRNW
jgi:hypothetical protein